MVDENHYELVDAELEHEDCVRIPYPAMAYGWARFFYQPEEKRFFYDFYSCGVIADDETRYHGSEGLTVEEIRQVIKTDWPKNPSGIAVLNGILARDFPDAPPVEGYDG